MRSSRPALSRLALATALALALGLLLAPMAGAAPAWLSPKRIARAGASPGPLVGIGPNGHAMAVWHLSPGSVVQAAPYKPTTHRWGRPVNLNAPVPSEDESAPDPQVGVDHDGNAIAVWGGLRGVRAARYDAAAGSWSPAVALSPGRLVKPSRAGTVAFDANGNALAIWSEGGRVIQAARYDAATNNWGPAASLSVLTPLRGEPRLAVAPNGNAMAVWTRCQGSCSFVQAAAYAAATNTWSPAVDVAPRQRSLPRPRVGIQASGDVTAAWQSGDSVQVARYDAATRNWGAPVGRPVPDGALFVEAAFGPSGAAIAVWQIRGQRQSGIQAARYDAATNQWGAVRSISAPEEAGNPLRPGETDGFPQVASGPTGDAIAVWQRQTGAATLIQAARYDVAARRWGDVRDLAASGTTTGLGPAPRVAVGAGQKAIAIWTALINGRRAIQAAVYANQCRGRQATHVGTDGNNVLRGTNGADVFDAGGGNDRIIGLRGNDRVCAGPGRDVVNAGPGDDIVFADPGNDVARGGAGDDRLLGNNGNDLLDGGAGRRDVANGGDGLDRCIRVLIRRSC